MDLGGLCDMRLIRKLHNETTRKLQWPLQQPWWRATAQPPNEGPSFSGRQALLQCINRGRQFRLCIQIKCRLIAVMCFCFEETELACGGDAKEGETGRKSQKAFGGRLTTSLLRDPGTGFWILMKSCGFNFDTNLCWLKLIKKGGSPWLNLFRFVILLKSFCWNRIHSDDIHWIVSNEISSGSAHQDY